MLKASSHLYKDDAEEARIIEIRGDKMCTTLDYSEKQDPTVRNNTQHASMPIKNEN